MEKNSRNPALAEQPPKPLEPRPKSPPAGSQKVAFKLGGSEETDLDNNEMETKDIDISSGKK